MFELKEVRKNIPEEELLADVKRVAELLGKNKITFREYNEHGNFTASTIVARLGKWSQLLPKIDLEAKQIRNISTEELFSNLIEVWTKIGKQPTYRDLTANISRYSSNTYQHRFGSWNNALRSFIAFVNGADIESYNTSDLKTKNKSTRRTTRDINWRLRAKILIKNNCICQMCGASPAKSPDVILHVDHIKPWSKGGETIEENLRTLCHVCNIGKSDMEIL